MQINTRGGSYFLWQKKSQMLIVAIVQHCSALLIMAKYLHMADEEQLEGNDLSAYSLC